MTIIQQRRGTAAEWTAANTVLAAGEVGFELDTGKKKTGDGVTPWASLQYHITEGNVDAKLADSMAAHLAATDPHPVYLTSAEGGAAYEPIGAVANHVAAPDPHPGYLQPSEIMAGANITVDTTTSPGAVIISGQEAGTPISDHGSLQGLTDDDHPQYHTDARADARYSPIAHTHDGVYDPAGTAVSGDSAHVAAVDPHPQYITDAEGDAKYATFGYVDSAIDSVNDPIKIMGSLPDGNPPPAAGTDPGEAWIDPTGGLWVWDGAAWVHVDVEMTADHGTLTGLADDDHLQYHTDARGDARYSPITHTHDGVYDPVGTAAAGDSAHVAAADPHPQYMTDAEGDAKYAPIFTIIDGGTP